MAPKEKLSFAGTTTKKNAEEAELHIVKVKDIVKFNGTRRAV